MHKLHLIWIALRGSFWFLPYMIVIAFIGTALGLTQLRAAAADLWLLAFPQLFSVSAAGARAMLSTIASSMISVVGIVFSMTLVALALASSQYSSRVLRTFMRSRLTPVSIGVFAGLHAYCLIVLRVIRGQEGQIVVPVAAVSLAVMAAVATVALLIYFIHHIAVSIQAATILANIADETVGTIEDMFPRRGADTASLERHEPAPTMSEYGRRVLARKSGYIQSVDESALHAFACQNETWLCVEYGVGQFVIAGATLMRCGPASGITSEALDGLHAMVGINAHRTVEQDPAFGIRQIVDVALKALSPSINDTTTAVMAIDYLGAIVAALTDKSFSPPCRRDGGAVRLVTVQADFDQLVRAAFDEIRRSASGNVSVILHMARAIGSVGKLTTAPERRRVLAQQLVYLEELSSRTVAAAVDRTDLQRVICDERVALLAPKD